MKKLTLITCIFCALFSLQNLKAQSVAALHQSGQTTYFTGVEALREAYAAAANGATIYLSGGSFLVPVTIAKSIQVFGVGHNPNFSGATGQTLWSGDLTLEEGADGSHFEGLHITGRVVFTRDKRIDDVVIRRCRINGEISFASSTNNTNHSYNLLIAECILTFGSSHNLYNARNLTITNSILLSMNLNGFYFGTIANSLLLNTSGYLLFTADNSILRNCVIAKSSGTMTVSTTNTSILNNVFFSVPSFPSGNNTITNNYISVSRENFFVNQSGNILDYTHDYHLQSPGQYVGTDGTQVGLYGGMHPFKEGSVPMIPHVVSKSISHSIDAEGKLQVEIEVSAQDH
jgi:hypothetical protein